MRKTNRIYPFCTALANYWSIYFPDLRFGQMMMNFFAWHNATYRTDPFYIEEDEFLKHFQKWCTEAVSRNK